MSEERDREDDRQRFLAHRPHTLGLPTLFYGSLQAPEVFGPVIGAPLESFRSEAVLLDGHKLAQVMAGGGFPGIFPDPAARALDCLMVHGLTPAQRHRVAWYEWDEYRFTRFILTDGREAEAFLPHVETIERLHGPVTLETWRYADWRARHLEDAAGGADGWMAEMPDITPLISAA